MSKAAQIDDVSSTSTSIRDADRPFSYWYGNRPKCDSKILGCRSKPEWAGLSRKYSGKHDAGRVTSTSDAFLMVHDEVDPDSSSSSDQEDSEPDRSSSSSFETSDKEDSSSKGDTIPASSIGASSSDVSSQGTKEIRA